MAAGPWEPDAERLISQVVCFWDLMWRRQVTCWAGIHMTRKLQSFSGLNMLYFIHSFNTFANTCPWFPWSRIWANNRALLSEPHRRVVAACTGRGSSGQRHPPPWVLLPRDWTVSPYTGPLLFLFLWPPWNDYLVCCTSWPLAYILGCSFPF